MQQSFLRSVFLLSIFVISSFNLSAQSIDPSAKPVHVNGSLGGNFSQYSVSGIPQRRQPYGYSLFGHVNFQIYNFSVPFSVAISQQGTSFSQPFSRFGISPEYKWVKVHLGHRNLNYSEFTLGGVTFLGAGVELTPGKFRFSAMYGRLRKAIEVPDNLFETPQYQRMGYGAKIGYGDKSFIDLSIFTAKDDEHSLSEPDRIKNLRNQPEASTSVGLTGRVNIAENRWLWDYNLAVSGYTRNLNALAFSEVSENGYGIGLLEKLNVNTSSNAALAGTTGLQYKADLYTLGVKYRYVQSGYRTLGTDYLLNDVEMITLNGAVQMFNQKLGLSGSYGIQNNDLSNRKFAKTGRRIGSANLNYRPDNKWSFAAGFSNFSIYQTVLKDSLFADSIVVDQTNFQVNFTATYVMVSPKYTHTYTLSANVQNLSDNRESPASDAGSQLMSYMFNYGLRFNQKKFGINFGANYQDFSSLLTTQVRYGGSIGFNIQLLDQKMNARIRHTWNRSRLKDRNDDLFNSQITLSYAISKKHSVNASTGFISRFGQNKFTEWRNSIGYQMRF